MFEAYRTLFILAAVGALFGAVAGRPPAQEWAIPSIEIPKDANHPRIACTGEELARLKAAYEGAGPEHDVVAAVVARAETAIANPILFPPRGGQHNQWYQCEVCQMGLMAQCGLHAQGDRGTVPGLQNSVFDHLRPRSSILGEKPNSEDLALAQGPDGAGFGLD